MIEIKTKNIIIGIIVALVLSFLGGWALGRFQRDDASRSIIQGLNDVMRTYTYKISDLQKSAWEKDAIITTQKQAIREGLLVKEELRKLKIKYLSEVTHLQTTVEILLDSISHTGTIIISPCPPDEEHPVLYLPLTFQEKNKFLDLRGEFNEQGKLSMDIDIPLDLSIYTGWDKKTKKIKSVVTTNNNYVKIQDILTLKTDLAKQSRWGVGIWGGYAIPLSNPLEPTPAIGVGIYRTILRF